jgi:hypothetical protein
VSGLQKEAPFWAHVEEERETWMLLASLTAA